MVMGKATDTIPRKDKFLPEETLGRLEELFRREKDPREAIKLCAYIMRKEGETVRGIADKLNRHYDYIYGCLRHAAQAGIGSRYDREMTGPISRLDDKAKKRLLEDLLQGPRDCGFEAEAWTAQLVGEHIRTRYNVHRPTTTGVRRLLKEMGFSLRHQEQHIPMGPKFVPSVTKNSMRRFLAQEKDLLDALKLRAYIMRKEGGTVRGIADKLETRYDYIRGWLERAAQNGIGPKYEQMKRRPGAPSRMSEKDKKQLLEDLGAGPKKCGFEAERWTAQLVREHIGAKYGAYYRIRGVVSILRRLDFSLRYQKSSIPMGPEFLPAVTVKEMQDLLRKEKDPKAALRLRACIMRKEGGEIREIVDEIGKDYVYVSRWLGRIAHGGVEARHDKKPPGTGPRLDAEAKKQLLRDLRAGPKKCGFEAARWSSSLVGKHIRAKHGVQYSAASIQHVLKILDFSLRAQG